MMFSAMLTDAWRQTRDQWIQWVLYVAIVLVLIGVAVLPIDSMAGFLGSQKSANAVATPSENKMLLWAGFKYLVASGLAGWVGLIIALIMTASHVPTMLRPGGVDLMASYPHERWKILLARYLGGIVFIAWYTSLMILGMYVVVGLRGGGWEPQFLLAVPATVGAFAVLYSISTLLGVLSRNTILAILGTLAIWLLMFILRLVMTFCFSQALQYYAVSEPKMYEFAKMDAESKIKIETDAQTGQQKVVSAAQGVEKREDLLASARSWESAGNIFYSLAMPFPNMDVFAVIYIDLSKTSEMQEKQDKEKLDMEAAMQKYRDAADTTPESKEIVGKLDEITGRLKPTYARDGTVVALFTLAVLGLAMWRFSKMDF